MRCEYEERSGGVLGRPALSPHENAALWLDAGFSFEERRWWRFLGNSPFFFSLFVGVCVRGEPNCYPRSQCSSANLSFHSHITSTVWSSGTTGESAAGMRKGSSRKASLIAVWKQPSMLTGMPEPNVLSVVDQLIVFQWPLPSGVLCSRAFFCSSFPIVWDSGSACSSPRRILVAPTKMIRADRLRARVRVES